MPKREDDFWASQKEDLRYCSKHKRYYRADVGCQLCWMEEHQGKPSPKLRECPVCHEMSLFQTGDNLFECLNLKCSKYQKRQSIEPHAEQKTNVIESHAAHPGATSSDREHVSDEESMRLSAEYGRKISVQAKELESNARPSSSKSSQTDEAGKSGRRKNIKPVKGGGGLPKWTIALLFIFAISIVGTGISLYAGTFIPFWIMFGFSVIFSIEKWFSYYTRKHKWIGKLYRLILNLSILSLLGLLIWSGIRLFSSRFTYSALVGSLIFLAEFVFFIWVWRVISKNSWRWPSMKLTVFALICLSVVFGFAGVQPMASYKDKIVSTMSPIFNTASQPAALSPAPSAPAVIKPPNTTPPGASSSATTKPPVSTSTPAVPTAIVAGATSSIDRSAFPAIDQYALGTPESEAKSIDSLAAYLVQPAKNDFEKTRAIYRWITQNVAYDFSAYLTGSYGSTRATDVLVSRKSVCQGYSSLFEALAKSAGLQVVTISGWAKGYSYTVGDQIVGATNHAWNAVKINGGWYLIDSTWGSGSIIQQRFVREFDEAYFFTPPDQFIYNHLPEDSKWQLLSTPFSKADYSALPYVHSDFFKYELKLGYNTQSVINVKGRLSMTFPVANDIYLMARISQGNVELSESFTSAQRSGTSYLINATFPNPGTYTLSIYARKGGEFGMYDGVLEYKVNFSTP
ncbi:hypothetical protein C1O63_1483 [Dehalococcoides mccartyi]|uniref:transglutaminase domain-containing protein n=1 Tax=Dehalococcoides mccartyi TaxID=61435 RepID=UPI000CDEA3AF|nr:transglutaminase domain-containing protein [Dehalococcoides mccartyi]POZ58436.1 hypothetical protein C1O63_1483 [Dehalococcoides mccartyi]